MLEHDKREDDEDDMDSLEEPDESVSDWRRLTMRFVALHMRRTAEGRRIMWRKDRNGNPPDSRYRDRYNRYNDHGWRKMPSFVLAARSAGLGDWESDFLEPLRDFDLDWGSYLEDEWEKRKLTGHTSVSTGWESASLREYLGALVQQIPFVLS